MSFSHRGLSLALLVTTLSACGGGGTSEPVVDDPFVPATDLVADAVANALDALPSSPVAVEDSGAPSAPSEPDASTEAEDTSANPIAPDSDSGAPPADVGAPPVDAGATPVDAGATPVDTGTKPVVVPPPPPTATEYAPYFYTWGWGNSVYPFTSLVDMEKKTGLRAATLAFVVSSGGCTLSRAIQGHASDIAAFRAVGGAVKASFGGATGTYIENGCTTTAALTSAIEGFVTETGITDLDFDVEQSVATTATVNARRAAALAAVQKSKGIQVSFTLQANPSSKTGAPGGMSSGAMSVVKAALDAGVVLSHVNLMTMDYGESFSSGRKMGDLAISAVNGAVAQLKTLIPGLTDARAYALIGATPMIGQNDVASEVFTLSDASTLVAFAKDKGLGLLSFWAIQRDAPCGGAVDLVLCTNAQTAKYQFHNVFKTVR